MLEKYLEIWPQIIIMLSLLYSLSVSAYNTMEGLVGQPTKINIIGSIFYTLTLQVSLFFGGFYYHFGWQQFIIIFFILVGILVLIHNPTSKKYGFFPTLIVNCLYLYIYTSTEFFNPLFNFNIH